MSVIVDSMEAGQRVAKGGEGGEGWRRKRRRRTILSVEIVPYVRKGDSPDKFLIEQPVFRSRRQPWTREVRERMEVDVIKGRTERPS